MQREFLVGRVWVCLHRRRGSEFALIREIGSDFSVKSHQRKNVTLCGVFSLVIVPGIEPGLSG